MAPSSFIAPMKATSGTLPTGDGWVAEVKWDGMRLQLHIDGRLRSYSGSGRDVTSSFPEFEGLAAAIGTSVVLDAEVVAFDTDRPSFAKLQHRIHAAQPTPTLLGTHPTFLMIFDLLELDGRSLAGLPYLDRRRLLTDLVEAGPAWRVPEAVPGGGASLFEMACDRDLEGIVVKRATSTYQPGRRSSDWVKVKVRKSQEFVVVGWTPGAGGLAGTIGALVLGVYEGDDLVPVGSVGSGLTDRHRALLSSRFVEAQCHFSTERHFSTEGRTESHFKTQGPKAGTVWVEPEVVVQVEYSIWAPDQYLWHPVFRGVRTDKHARDVVREDLP